MGGVSPGSITNRMPPAEDDQARRARDLARAQSEQASARSLEATSIGEGGLRVIGGSIDIEAGGELNVDGDATFNGNLTVPAGSLNTAGAISAGGNMTAGGAVQGAAVISTGNASVAGTLTAGALSSTGNVSASGEVVASGKVRGGNIWGNILSVDYRVVYVSNPTGELGHVPSSRRFKTCIEPARLDLDAVLGLELRTFKYKQAIEAYGSVDDAPTELGLIAEEVDEAGAGYLVYRGEDGEVDGVAYERLGLPLLAIAQRQARQLKRQGRELKAQATRIEALEAAFAQLQ